VLTTISTTLFILLTVDDTEDVNKVDDNGEPITDESPMRKRRRCNCTWTR